MFAQVTNPPVDPIRERLAMSLRIQLGKRGPILEDSPSQAHLIELSSPIISDAELEAIVRSGDRRLFSHWISTTWPVSEGPAGMRKRIDEICAEAADAVRLGATILVLSDRETDADHAPVPILLALGSVHHHLIDEGVRGDVSIVVVSGEPRDAHDIATLVAFGCSAVNPYLAIDQVIELAGGRHGGRPGDCPGELPALARIRPPVGHVEDGDLHGLGLPGLGAVRGDRVVEKVCRRAFRNAPASAWHRFRRDRRANAGPALAYREDVIRSGGSTSTAGGEVPHHGTEDRPRPSKSVRSGADAGALPRDHRRSAPALVRPARLRRGPPIPLKRWSRRIGSCAGSPPRHVTRSPVREAHETLAGR